ncbi:hypothetical protein CVV65_10030 [Kyrpidia spormannii]|uniref:Uncharacterized protein n=1 Tax=Kyrpidia spormannii TaxID=2055160 RepID=A0A2K8N790_9BACL|nr:MULTISPECIES: hypothetical protein [Kyrpidia]ATY85221.1 hypothetical protein CVV65_10030 [Kyrpidia spormannii]MCL6575872.1 hypothetical protein [Kyrpidia sp.]CAB3393914.1 conserved exported protein of unknown function [Kyrpidia spormannii]
MKTRPKRLTRRLAIPVVVLILLVIAYASAAPRVTVPVQAPLQDVSNAEADPILAQLKTIGNLDEVYMEKDNQGRVIVYTTAFVDVDDPNPIQAAKSTAQKVITAIYRSGVPVANATILITRNNHPLLGASLGSDTLRKASLSVLSQDSVDAFTSFLASTNHNDPQHLEQSTWLEIDPSAAQ